MTQIATAVYVLGILVLFLLARDTKIRTSKALWIPVVWLLIGGSRPVSVWLGVGPSGSPEQYLEGSPIDRNIYTGLLIAGIGVLWTRRARVSRILRTNPVILLFFSYCAVSVVWSDYPGVALKRWIKSLSDLVVILIILTDLDWSCALKRVLSSVSFVLIPVSVLLIKYYPDMSRYYSRWEGRQFVSGVAEDKNMLGMTCLVYGVAACWMFLETCHEPKRRNRTRRLIAHGTVFAMVIWLLWMANSMTALACFAMTSALLAMTSLMRVDRRPKLVHLLVGAIVCVSFSALLLNVGGGALEMMGRDPTLTGRTVIWQGLLAVSGNPLFGTGFESFWLGERMRKIWGMGGMLYGINESHNGYLEVFLNLGWIGVALLALLVLTGYRNVVAAFRRAPGSGRLRLAFFVMAIVYNQTEAAFKMGTAVWISFLLAIMAVPTAPIPNRQGPARKSDWADSRDNRALDYR